MKIFIPLLLIVCIASAGFSFKYFKAYEEATENNISKEEIIGSMQVQLDSVLQKSFADELFINGHYDSAMLAYQTIPGGGYDNHFTSGRKKIINEMAAFHASLRMQAENAETQAEFRQNMQGLELTSIKLQYEAENDSIKAILNDRIKSLENQLQIKEQALAEVPEIGRIVFYNNNGTKINYFGEINKGKANGQGIGNHATGSVYDGTWKDNKKHGKGTYKWAQGEIYEGEFVDDRREGEGTYYWPDGNKYIGQWEYDVRNGSGTLYDKDNRVVLKGEWSDNELNKKAN